MAQCDEQGMSQVSNLHLGRGLSRVSDFVRFTIGAGLFYKRHKLIYELDILSKQKMLGI